MIRTSHPAGDHGDDYLWQAGMKIVGLYHQDRTKFRSAEVGIWK